MLYCESYRFKTGLECLGGCILNYYLLKGIDINAYECFFKGDGFHVEYNEKKQILGTNIHKANRTFLKNEDVDFEELNCINYNNAFTHLKYCVDEEKCICIRVASEMLDHNQIFKRHSRSPHYLGVIGYELNNIYIFDAFVPLATPISFSGWVDLNEIMKAWEAMNYEYISFDLSKKNSRDMDINDRVLNSINRYLIGGKEEYIYIGHSAIREAIKFLRDSFFDDSRIQKFIHFNYQIKMYGFIASKKHMLNWMNNNILDTHLKEGYKSIIEQWVSITALYLKSSMSNDFILFQKAQNMAEKCIDIECDIFKHILNNYKGNKNVTI